jgi:molybdopterin synthase sulfur carrier subunit
LIIKFYSTLRDIAGKKVVELDIPEGTTIQQLATEIVERYPKMRRDLLDDNGKIHGHVHMFVDGLDVPFLTNNTSEIISNKSIVDVFHAIGGGNYHVELTIFPD